MKFPQPPLGIGLDTEDQRFADEKNSILFTSLHMKVVQGSHVDWTKNTTAVKE